jgi:uncharacterized membrane protein
VAVALGATLVLLFVRGTAPRSSVAGIVHGCTGAVGLGLLILVLQGPRRGDAMGAGSFGIFAAVLFSFALAIGPLIRLLARRLPNVTGAVIATHASFAITAFVLFLAWASM